MQSNQLREIARVAGQLLADRGGARCLDVVKCESMNGHRWVMIEVDGIGTDVGQRIETQLGQRFPRVEFKVSSGSGSGLGRKGLVSWLGGRLFRARRAEA